jgi:hypothetical protein
VNTLRPGIANEFYAPDAQKAPLGGDPVHYSHVRCKLTRPSPVTSTSATVVCTFTVTTDTPSMTNVTFWQLHEVRKPPGPWLVYSYGQG